MEETKTEEEELKEVDLTAIRYKWECPICNSTNEESEAKSDLECRQCEKRFGVGELSHTFEWGGKYEWLENNGQ